MIKYLIILFLISSPVHARIGTFYDAKQLCSRLPTINQVKHLNDFYWTMNACPRDKEFAYIAGKDKIHYELKYKLFNIKCAN